MYKIIKCESCKEFHMTSAKKKLKCIKCNKYLDLTRMKIYFESENPTIVSKVLMQIKKEVFLNSKQDQTDELLFKSY